MASNPGITPTVVTHPLVQHKLTIMRKTETACREFRQLLHEIGLMLGYEALKDLPTKDVEITTPVATTTQQMLDGKKLCLVSIWRAGDGLLAPFLDLVPSARVAHLGLARNEETLKPEPYKFVYPGKLDERVTVVLDPMLATGNSAAYAVQQMKDAGATDIRFVCLLAAPEGIETLSKAHPDVPITTAAIDSHLNEKGYIVPGLGDAGDRIFGTKG